MPYDLFISYSRRDNASGRITELKQRIEADYRAFAQEDLRCFFDLDDIHGMDDWRHRILQGLRESQLLLLALSPGYLESPYCEWEIVEYLKYEHSRAAAGQGVAPVYFVEVPGLDTPEFEQTAAAWVARVRRRNHFDLREWYDEGEMALKRLDVRARLDDLEKTLHTRISKLRRLAAAPGNLPAHNPHFVGRETEMTRLHESAGLGRFGVLTAIQGMGGLGKTALAIQYACAYADFYPGGRWLVGCAGETSLAGAIRKLEADLGITFNEEEKRDDARAARRVLAELETRARQGAAARAGESDPPQPRALLLLDNVDDAALLQPPQSDLISGKRWLHGVATTRMGGDEFGHDPERQMLLAVDELPVEDAVRLIETHQPDGRFPNAAERAAAEEIANVLGGFTLAIEVVAIHLRERRGRITCAAFLERLRREGLGGFEAIAKGTKGGVSHQEKLVSATLGPTLDLLSPQEQLVLAYAALLPPDTLPLPWLRELVVGNYPGLGKDAGIGYDDPWLDLVNHLLGLRLLQVVDIDPETHAPRLVRMHRLVGELVRERNENGKSGEATVDRVVEHALTRSEHLEKDWFKTEAKWEIDPLIAFVDAMLGCKHDAAPKLVKYVGQWHYFIGAHRRYEQLHRFAIAQLETAKPPNELEIAILSSNLGNALNESGELIEAEVLLRKALEIDERKREPDHPFIAIRLNGLASLLQSKGDYSNAEPLLRRALTIDEKRHGLDHRSTLVSVSSLASLLSSKGDYGGAQPLYERALEGFERVLGPEHPDTLASVNNLAALLYGKGDYAGAQPLFERTLEARERVLGPEHPDTLSSVNNLAALLHNKGDYAGAQPLHERALEARERVLGPEHPATLTSVNSLAGLLSSKGDHAGAQPLYERALEANERVLGPEHPDTLSSVNNLAHLLWSKGDHAGAQPLYERALEANERVLGPEHPATLSSVNNLGALLDSKGDYAGAQPLYERALEARERVLGPEHPDTLMSVANLAVLLESKGDHAGAQPLFERALEARERVLGPEHPDTLMTMQNLAGLLEKVGRAPDAMALRSRRLEAIGKRSGSAPLELRTAALDACRIGDYELARTLLERVLAANFELPGTHCHLARVCLLTNRIEDARSHAEQAWDHRTEAPPYVVPRILWLQLASTMLSPDTATRNPRSAIPALLGMLKTAFQADGAHMEWTMQPVLEKLEGRIKNEEGGEEHFALLTTLVAACNEKANLPALDQFPAWREATPQPLKDHRMR